MIKKVLVLFLTMSLLGFAMHKYYVSITEGAYNFENQKFEFSIKFIGHDLEKALASGGTPDLFLGTKKELEKADDYLKKYIEQRLHIVIDGESLQFNFIGKEVNNDDFIYCYIESNKIALPKEILIKNTLLSEVFNEQSNIVYMSVGDKKLNYSLNRNKVSETHSLN